MKYFFFISLLFNFSSVLAQDNPLFLSQKLTASLNTDKEKVTAIFSWITRNISYSTRNGIAKLKGGEVVEDDEGPLKPLTERVAIAVLKRKMGVCDGYARLFTSLCNYAGIRSELVIGFAKATANKPIAKFGVNHYWNAVFFDGQWHLLDATWASGYLTSGGKDFIRDYDEKYFLTRPEVFIQDHYPDDLRWTLLPDSKIPNEFLKTAFKQKSFSKYKISSFSPKDGIINTYVGDTISLSLETAIAEDRRIASSQIVNPVFFCFSSSWVFLKPDSIENRKGIYSRSLYNYTVTTDKIQWLFLVYNHDLVLRYKVNVKDRKG